MQGLAALCHTARKGGYIGSRSTYTVRASSLLDKTAAPNASTAAFNPRHPRNIGFVVRRDKPA